MKSIEEHCMEVLMSANNQAQKLLAEYERVVRAIRIRLLEYYNPKMIWGLIAETRRELGSLISEMPYIGEHHVWQSNLNLSVMSLALYRVLLKNSFLIDEATQITDDIFQVYLLSFPRPLRMAYLWYFFSALHKNGLRESALRSQQRGYPGDWVFTYVEGDGKTFDIGVNISECAILKFYQAHKAERFIPYLCRFDDITGRLLGLGFKRTGTLASGSNLCDCRWKYDRVKMVLPLPQEPHPA